MQTLAFSCAFISYILPVEWNNVWMKRQLLNVLLTLRAPSLINFHTACWRVETVVQRAPDVVIYCSALHFLPLPNCVVMTF